MIEKSKDRKAADAAFAEAVEVLLAKHGDSMGRDRMFVYLAGWFDLPDDLFRDWQRLNGKGVL